MYAIKNNVQLVGSVVEKPVIKGSVDGRKTARFSIFIEDCYNNSKGQKITETQSHMVVAQGKAANIAEKYLGPEMMVVISGRLVNRHFRDSKGISRVVTEVHVNELMILDMQVQEDEAYYMC
ncbi:MAG: single-stranded DNA-binding protein [Chitinophagaceae bacterium]|nr:single-stranded DNA-binding protein [Chitinophagaceae bacterium]